MTWALLALALAGPGAPGAAEREAAGLRDDLQRDARRQLWAGADEAYRALVALGVPMTAADHEAGWQAADKLGRAAVALERARRAVEAGGGPVMEEVVARIEASYGAVRVVGAWRRPPRFVRERMPFLPDQRAAVEHAKAEVESTGGFVGLLPVGEYLIGDQRIEVAAGGAELVVDVRRPGGPGALNIGEATQRGGGFAEPGPALLYVGPVVGLFGGVGGATALRDGLGSAGMWGGGARVDAGVELGVSPRVAVVLAGGWQGAWGADDGVDHVHGAALAALRLDRVRLALGPAMSGTWQRGFGVVGVGDRADDADPRADGDLPYRGRTWGPGARFDLGVRLAELGALDLEVGLAVGWQGGPQDVITGGLGLRLVPEVPDVGQR